MTVKSAKEPNTRIKSDLDIAHPARAQSDQQGPVDQFVLIVYLWALWHKRLHFENFNFTRSVHCEQGLSTYLQGIVFNITGVAKHDGYNHNSRFHVMPQKQELLAFVEKQAAKSLVNSCPKSPVLLPKPIRREFSDKLSYWKYQFDGTF